MIHHMILYIRSLFGPPSPPFTRFSPTSLFHLGLLFIISYTYSSNVAPGTFMWFHGDLGCMEHRRRLFGADGLPIA
jgi:hypothetical protein